MIGDRCALCLAPTLFGLLHAAHRLFDGVPGPAAICIDLLSYRRGQIWSPALLRSGIQLIPAVSSFRTAAPLTLRGAGVPSYVEGVALDPSFPFPVHHV